jgi:hypothetical protein
MAIRGAVALLQPPLVGKMDSHCMKSKEKAESRISGIEKSPSVLRRASGNPAQTARKPAKSDSNISKPQKQHSSKRRNIATWVPPAI